MTAQNQSQQRILVVGAGRGGTAMLELFLVDPQIEIVGVIDADPNAPALAVAAAHGVRTFTNLAEAVEASRPCLAFNLTSDESVTAYAEEQLGAVNVIGGFQANFIWNLLTRLRKSNEQFTHLAHHDILTGLPNRILFYDRLNQAITRARRDKESFAVLHGAKPGGQVAISHGRHAGRLPYRYRSTANAASAAAIFRDSVGRRRVYP